MEVDVQGLCREAVQSPPPRAGEGWVGANPTRARSLVCWRDETARANFSPDHRDQKDMRTGQRQHLARRLRRALTPAEQALWRHLRGRQRCGVRFRRQHPIGPFVVDFACLVPALVIEVDGGQHCGSRTDAVRDAYLRRRGFHVFRFWNHDVLQNPDGVCRVIDAWLESRDVRMR